MLLAFLSVGTGELLIVALLSVAAGIVWAFCRPRAGWLIGIPVCMAIAAVVTPADPLSALIVAVPYTVGYLILVRSRREHARQRA
jgi:Sec-independent protein secretion pathway component TatC